MVLFLYRILQNISLFKTIFLRKYISSVYSEKLFVFVSLAPGSPYWSFICMDGKTDFLKTLSTFSHISSADGPYT